MAWLHLPVLLLFLCCVNLTAGGETKSPPQKVGQPLLCEGCVAVLLELHKQLKDSSGHKKAVTSSVRNLCNVNNFLVYKFSPPKMVKACNYVTETFKTELEESLKKFYKKYKTKDNRKLLIEFCKEKTSSCEDIPNTKEQVTPEGLTMEEANEELHNRLSESKTKPNEVDVESMPSPDATKTESKDEL
ncbi:uncharacterized protein LOC111086292 [Limulus polyphemus]|uniref:Uncharacterized protein LOC111086292 n=1 Tax=Limulus polyphemus TaxID=6850 RepID=A0ABM1SL17_LIMPO|nr:uncharacterized protein LOC111086292 [Limulus polyphemus]